MEEGFPPFQPCIGGLELHVDVLEDVRGSDALRTVRGFNEIIPRGTLLHAATDVGDGAGFVETFGFGKKASAVELPVIHGRVLTGRSLAGRRDGEIIRVAEEVAVRAM